MTEHEYLMHYVGSGLYGIRRFINEAKRIGVQRAIPFNMLRHVKWGEPILLADHKKVPVTPDEKMPVAMVFAYFKVDSLSYQLDPDVKEKLLSKVTIVSSSMPQREHEQRACGSYDVGMSFEIKESIEEVVQKIEEACLECKKSINNFKYFLKGEIKVLDAPIIMRNTKFNRGYRKVTLDGLKLDKEKPKKALFFLNNYSRRMYMTKDDEKAYDNVLITEFIDNTT